MSKKEKRKISDGRKPRDEIVKAVTEKAQEGTLPCALAHSIAKAMNVSPEEVGFAADVQGVTIVKCQLGLFGYGSRNKKVEPLASVPPELKKAIEAALQNGRLGCAVAWRIADELHVSRMEVSSACEAMKIKISHCQLGAF